MKVRVLMSTMILATGLAGPGSGQSPVIESLSGNGLLEWTHAVNSQAVYRVEWAAQAEGPWYQTFQNIHTVDGHNRSNFLLRVPMFYRVVMATNGQPQGMVWIEGGDVVLGDIQSVGYEDERPIHTNWISGFWMDATEVTKKEWDTVADWASTNGYDLSPDGASARTNNHPVYNVSWYEAVKWCNARSQKEGLTPCYYVTSALDSLYTNLEIDVQNDWTDWTVDGYRLPTEAEWEKASRSARQGRLFPWGGDTIQQQQADYSANPGSPPYDINPTAGWNPEYNVGDGLCTAPVGSFPASGLGLHDMAGNVSEWCGDWYDDYAAAGQPDPHGPESSPYDQRVLRGGSWYDYAILARCAARYFMEPEVGDDNGIGFRSVRRGGF
jgi:formylglycine-generating enzyme required for sulfatase activity